MWPRRRHLRYMHIPTSVQRTSIPTHQDKLYAPSITSRVLLSKPRYMTLLFPRLIIPCNQPKSNRDYKLILPFRNEDYTTYNLQSSRCIVTLPPLSPCIAPLQTKRGGDGSHHFICFTTNVLVLDQRGQIHHH